MIIRFVAEILDEKGNPKKAPIKVETGVPDITEFILFIDRSMSRATGPGRYSLIVCLVKVHIMCETAL